MIIPVIRGNQTSENGRSGIQINGDCGSDPEGVISGALIENNTVYGNTAKGMSLISMQDSIVQNNIIYDNKGGAGGIHLTEKKHLNLILMESSDLVLVEAQSVLGRTN